MDYLVFEDEGHDVLMYENRVTCYTAITEFFNMYLSLDIEAMPHLLLYEKDGPFFTRYTVCVLLVHVASL